MISHSYPSRPPIAWALAFTALVLAATLFSGCTEPLTPMLPEWDVDANVPLINHTYTMQDMLNDDDVLRISENGDQVLVVTQRYPLNSICLGDYLTMGNVAFQASETFNAVRFELPDYLDQQLDVFTLFPDLPRGPQVVSSIRNDLGISIAIDTREYFEEMTFATGKLAMEFSNNVPIPLRIEAVRLVDLSGTTIGQLTWGNLVQPGESVTLPTMSLDGVTLRNNMKLAFDISSPGSSSQSVDLTSAMSLGIKGELRDTDISSVRGFVPAQDMSYQRSVNITGTSGMKIRDGLVRSGSLQFTVKNYFAIGAQISVTLQNASRNGNPIAASVYVSPRSTKTLSLDLTDAVVKLSNESDLLYAARILTDDASENAVLVKKTDSVAVTGLLRDVRLASMTGSLSPTTLSVRRMEYSDFSIDKSIAGSIELSEAKMWAKLRNNSMLPVDIKEAAVLGKNTSGSSASLHVVPLDLAGHSETMIDFENTQVVSFLNSFSPEYPDSLGMEGTFILNPAGTFGSASAADSVVGDLFVEFPLRFTQIDGSVVDTVDMVIDESTRSKMNGVNEGELSFNVENHLPASVLVEAEFLDSKGNLLLVPTPVDGSPMQVSAAPLDAAGYVAQSVHEKIVLQFSAADFAKLAQATAVRFRLSFRANENGGASFRSTDYVRIRGYARLNVSSTITER